MGEFWIVAYDAEASENPGFYVHVTVEADGTLRTDPPPEPPGEVNPT